MQGLEYRSNSPLSPPPDRRRLLRVSALAYLLAIAVAIADYYTPRVNLSIFYAIPLILAARDRRRSPWPLALFLVALTYTGYFLKWKLGLNETPDFMTYRLMNRTFVAVALLLLSAVVPLWFPHPDAAANPALPGGRNYTDDFDQLLRSLLPVISLFTAGVMTGIIALVDLFSPRNFNLAILYSVPLFIFGWARSRALIWALTILLLCLTLLGYFSGPAPANEGARTAVNRIIASVVLILVACLLHASMDSDAEARHHD